MSKRKSSEPLEISAVLSPISKRARVEDVQDESLPAVKETASATNGTHQHEVVGTGDEEEESEESDEDAPDTLSRFIRQNVPTEGYSDLYLDTINRSMLDFDFEKLCSVTLSNINVYACLVCGRYFQGRGPKSHAYFHSLDEDHHVYINTETKKVYVLPEGYEVLNKSLDDIKYVVAPAFTEEEVRKLDKIPVEATDLANKRYRPGFIGMNNIKANDYLNVIVQTLSHVAPLRNFLLLHKFPHTASQLPVRLSTLVRKIWSSKAFRNHVSPHELLQEVAAQSGKRFNLTAQSDPVDFLSWFLNNLHLALGGSKTKPFSSIIQHTFQGRLKNETESLVGNSMSTTKITPYTILTLDLPPVPLFRDNVESKNVIPQVPLTTLLNKYNGLQPTEKSDTRQRFRLMHPLPPYLIFHIKRFSTNKFVSERNPTIVTFPSPRGLDMSLYVEPDPLHCPPGEAIVYEMVANTILDASTSRSTEESNAADATNKLVVGQGENVKWKVQLRDKAVSSSGRSGLPEWREIQDLYVERAEAETLFTRESYIMVWERKSKPRSQTNGIMKAK